jgi:hypothetical protein
VVIAVWSLWVPNRMQKRPNEPDVIAPCPQTHARGTAKSPQMLIEGRERSLQRHRLRAEAAALAADPEDVAETRRVLEDLEPLRAW